MSKFSIGKDEFYKGDLISVKWDKDIFTPYTYNGYQILSEYVVGESITLRYTGYLEYHHRDTGEVDEDGEHIYEQTEEVLEVCMALDYTRTNNEKYCAHVWLSYDALIGPPAKDKRWVSRRLVKMMNEDN